MEIKQSQTIPLPRVEVSVFVLGFFSCQGVTFSKKVATTFLSKKCNKSHILFPSSEGLGVGSLGSAFSMKSTTLDYPPLNPLPRGEVFGLVTILIAVQTKNRCKESSLQRFTFESVEFVLNEQQYNGQNHTCQRKIKSFFEN